MVDDQSARWLHLIERASLNRPRPLDAVEFRAATRHGKSRPVVLLCTDGTVEEEFVVKGMGEVIHGQGHIHPKTLFNDQVVGRVGSAMGATVPKVDLIHVPQDLIEMNWSMAHLLEGVAHGSRVIPAVTEAETILHCAQPENRVRFALLAVLFGWVSVEDDLQFIYDRVSPHLVHSVDHGDCFPRGPNWRVPDLAAAPATMPHEEIVAACGFGDDALVQAAISLGTIDDATIAAALAAPPDAWLVPIEERVALGVYLARRRDVLAAMLVV